MTAQSIEKPATTLQVCAAFGPLARVLPYMFDYSGKKQFSGPAAIVKPTDGRDKLNAVLRNKCSGYVVVIDARHVAPFAVIGPKEVANAIAGECRAILVFGAVYDVDKLQKEKAIPVYATTNSCRVLPEDGGEIWSTFLDCEAGLITSEFYLTGDADGIVALPRDQMQQHFSVE